jgi:hypothetical protein
MIEPNYYELDQSLYSRKTIKEDDTQIIFFSSSVGMFDANGEETLTYADTNMQSPSNVHTMFIATGIKFVEWGANKKLREHLMQYGYYILRIVDRDMHMHPIHLMTNYFYCLEDKFEELTIDQYMSFAVYLNLMKPYGEKFKLTCELLGKMWRVM